MKLVTSLTSPVISKQFGKFFVEALMRNSHQVVGQRKRSSHSEPRWPQPRLDATLAAALYYVSLEDLHSAAARMERVSKCGIRHFSAFRRVVPLSLAKVAARQIAREEREEVESTERFGNAIYFCQAGQ
jgi:hypothetical protein